MELLIACFPYQSNCSSIGTAVTNTRNVQVETELNSTQLVKTGKYDDQAIIRRRHSVPIRNYFDVRNR